MTTDWAAWFKDLTDFDLRQKSECTDPKHHGEPTMQRFIAVFSVRLPNGEEDRKYTPIFATDLSHAVEKWNTTIRRADEVLIQLTPNPSMQESFDSMQESFDTPAD